MRFKRTTSRVISIVLIMMLALSLVSFAYEDAYYTLKDSNLYNGGSGYNVVTCEGEYYGNAENPENGDGVSGGDSATVMKAKNATRQLPKRMKNPMICLKKSIKV